MEKVKQIAPYIVIGIMAMFMALGYLKYQSLSKVVTISNKFHKESLEQERKYRAELREEKDRITLEYTQKIETLQKKYKRTLWKLSQEKKKNKTKIINLIDKDPERVRKEWEEGFDFEYVQTNIGNSSVD